MIKFTLAMAIIGFLTVAAIGSISASVKPVFINSYSVVK